MDEREKKRQLKDIAHGQTYEDLKARKETSKLKRAAKGKDPARRKDYSEQNWEELEGRDARPRSSFDATVADLAPNDEQRVAGDAEWAAAAIVISVSSGRCRVYHDAREIDCIVPA